jgi:hypothetical protein
MHEGDDIPAPPIACMMRLQFDVQQVHAESVCSTRWYYTHMSLLSDYLVLFSHSSCISYSSSFFFVVLLLNLLYDPLCMPSLVGFASFMDFERKRRTN